MYLDISALLEHKGCDICINECDKPMLLYVAGQKFKGHKDCMRRAEHRLIKYASISRHTKKWWLV